MRIISVGGMYGMENHLGSEEFYCHQYRVTNRCVGIMMAVKKHRRLFMNTDEKLRRLSFLKNEMTNADFDNMMSIEPTICQVFKDIFGIGNEYTKSADKIRARTGL